MINTQFNIFLMLMALYALAECGIFLTIEILKDKCKYLQLQSKEEVSKALKL